MSLETLYHQMLSEAPEISDITAGATFRGDVQTEQDYSYTAERYAGPGYFIVGFDALPYGPQQATTGPCRVGAVRGSHDGDTGVVEPGFGVAVAVALVHDQDQPVRVVKNMFGCKVTRSTRTSRCSTTSIMEPSRLFVVPHPLESII
jgi:hypothetical protein